MLKEWEVRFRRGILREIKSAGIEFTRENIELIVQESGFQSRAKKVPTFDNCPYLMMNQPCHPEIQDLNCFLCPCPNYESDRLEGGCKVDSKRGKFTFHESLPAGKVWDCSDCNVSHSSKEVKEYLRANFEEIKLEYDKL